MVLSHLNPFFSSIEKWDASYKNYFLTSVRNNWPS